MSLRKRVFYGSVIGAGMGFVEATAGITVLTWQWWALAGLLVAFAINLELE